MGTDIVQSARNLVSRHAIGAVARITTDTRREQANVRAISAVAEFAVSEVEHLKRLQANAEQANPDTAEAVAALINTAVSSVARRVARFGSELE